MNMGMERWGFLFSVVGSPIVYFLKTTRAVCPNINPIMLCTHVCDVNYAACYWSIVKNIIRKLGWINFFQGIFSGFSIDILNWKLFVLSQVHRCKSTIAFSAPRHGILLASSFCFANGMFPCLPQAKDHQD